MIFPVLEKLFLIINSFMTEVPIIKKPVHWSMDWFLYDRSLRRKWVHCRNYWFYFFVLKPISGQWFISYPLKTFSGGYRDKIFTGNGQISDDYERRWTVSSVHNKLQLLPLGNHVFLSPRFHRGHSVVINMEEFQLISPTQFYIVFFWKYFSN